MKQRTRPPAWRWVLGLVLLTGHLAVTSPAEAAISCLTSQEGPSSRFAGSKYVGPTNQYGASAVISHRYGVLCDGQGRATNANTVWTALGAGDDRYAQIGTLRREGEPRNHFFFETQRFLTVTYQRTHYDMFDVNDGTNRFWVQLVPAADGVGTWHLRLNIDSSIMGVTGWDPFSQDGWKTGHGFGAWSGETKFLGSDMPGSTYNPSVLAQLSTQGFNGGGETWRPQYSGDNMAGMSPGGSRYGFAWTYADAFKIWTIGT